MGRRREGGSGSPRAPAPTPEGQAHPAPPHRAPTHPAPPDAALPGPPPGPLSAEDRALWARVAATIRPLDPRRAAVPAGDAARPSADGGEGAHLPSALPQAATGKPRGPAPGRAGPLATPPPPPACADAAWPPADFRVGAAARPGAPATIRLAPEPGQALREHPLRMDHKTHRRMTQGRIAPEARIDLHGMTLAIAQPVLTRFVLDARARGARLVLVITGKGRPGGPEAPLPVRPGALRHHVPHWLHMPPLGAIVLQVRPAHPRHGGEGAYYVWLRRADR